MNYKSVIFTLLVLLMATPIVKAQKKSKVELSIQLLIPNVLGERILDTELFTAWMTQLSDVYEEGLTAIEGNHEGLLLVNLTKDKAPEITLSFKPPVENEIRSNILNEIAKVGAHNTTNGEYTFFIRGRVNKGSTRKGDNFYPPVIFPREMRLAEFGEMNLQQKTVFLKAWVDKEVLPVLSKFEMEVDPKFEGVRAVGQMVANKEFIAYRTSDILDTNYLYWRAILEMQKGNQLIPLSRICMHLSNEEWDIAGNYLKMMVLFSDKNSLADYYTEEIKDMLNMLKEHINREIGEGIKLYDEGNLKEAYAKYNYLFQIVPKSAYLNYEMYLTEVTLMGPVDSLPKSSIRMVWDKHRPNIYGANPQYSAMAQASSGEEGYELVCRAMIKDLFKEKGETKRDLLRYAELATELEDYAFAAQMYWWLFHYLGNEAYEGTELISEFLYVLHQLGDTKVKANFEGDFEKEFHKIDVRRRLLKEADTMYQAFEKKE
jgi:hypothetical protein